ncbi:MULTISPECIES: MFS transporter [unclassified Exiguobacterium]|uniref:MDR family MFS transporter n=1 Tax=unclassified Exiguobacterium TaxID=2644629 RepID=UPI001BE86EB6|nr:MULTISPECIES: MFS transporter [unclassified Exiguobacterium]
MKWKEIPKPIKVRLVTSFFNRTVSFAIMPFMALLFVDAFNAVVAGLFLISTVFLSFFIGLIGGYLADRFPRKRLLVLSTTATGLMFLVMTISLAVNQMIAFTIAYAIFTVTSNIGRPAMGAIIIDATTPDNRRAVYAIDYWLINLSIALGTALGGWLYVSNKLFLFSLLTCTSLLLPVAYHFLLDESKHVWRKQPFRSVLTDITNSYRIAWRDRPFVKVVLGSMCILAAEFSMGSYVAVRLADEFKTVEVGGLLVNGVRMVSLISIENTILVVCLTFFIQRLANRFSNRKTLVAGLTLYLIGYMTVTSANSMTVLLTFIFIATIGELLYSPTLNAEKANMMPEDKRGAYSAFAGTSHAGADLISRSTIILGAVLAPFMMSVYIGLIVFLGLVLAYSGLYMKEVVETKRNVS